tara:strand:- start:456 stop:776 length:321 start_codon:yes stop_codon:yes gene_type:complete
MGSCVMTSKKKGNLSPEQREFNKVKRFVQKRFPGAHTVLHNGSFKVVDEDGLSVVSPELYMPPAKTIREAWNMAKYVHWFQNMMRKSNNAFDETKTYTDKNSRENW